MESMDWGAPIELTSGADPAEPGRYERFGALGDRMMPGRAVRRIAGALLVLGFALVVASQLVSWVSLVGPNFTDDGSPVSGTGQAVSVGIAEGTTFLLFSYYLVWLAVLVLCAACVFATVGPRQRVLFGAASGALATQTLVLLPLIHKPVAILGANSVFQSTPIVATREPGMFFAIAAIVVLAGAMIVAVGGRVLPSGLDAVPPPAGPPVYDPAMLPPEMQAPHAPDMHAALAASQPYQNYPDIEYGVTPPTPHTAFAMNGDAPSAPGVVPTEDHSPYIRPREAEESLG